MKHDTDMKRLFLLLLSFGIWVGLCRAEETEEQPYVNKDGYVSMATSYAPDGSKKDTYYNANGDEVTVNK